jgi:tRNA A-37 threonylcarbamoyl transferase component Bud32
VDERSPDAFDGAGGFRWRAVAEETAWTRDVLAPAPDAVDRLPGAREIKRNLVRRVVRVPREGRDALYVKRFYVSGILERLKFLVRPSRAEAEWRASRGLRAAGLPAAETVAVAESRAGPFLRGAIVVVREVPGCMELVPYLFRRFPGRGPRRGADARARLDLLDRLGRLLRSLHDAGWEHPDFHGGNLLVRLDEEPPVLTIIDLHTIRPRSRVSADIRERDLSKLVYSLMTATTVVDRARVLLAYEGDVPVLGGIAVLRRMEETLVDLDEARVRSRTRRGKVLGSTGRFAVASTEGRRLIHLRSWGREPFERALAEHRRLDGAGGAAVLKRGGRSLVTRVVVDTPDGPRSLIVKETRVRDFADRVKNVLRPPRAVDAWRAGQGLWHRRVDCADPLALAVEGGSLAPGRSFLVMEDVAEGERLDLRMLRLFGSGPLDAAGRAAKAEAMRAAGRWLGDLHRRGIYHGDLKGVNVFLRTKHGEPSLCLVDYDRVSFGGGPVALRRRVKNLAQLAASIGTFVSRSDRLRFYRAYAARFPGAWDERREVSEAVAAACARKIVVVREPIE